jgi:hypothetical protein
MESVLAVKVYDWPYVIYFGKNNLSFLPHQSSPTPFLSFPSPHSIERKLKRKGGRIPPWQP